jgi:nucleotide-binding universal stress UspA family protein
MRVLIPLDGSPCSLRAVEVMLGRLARGTEGEAVELHLVHVQAPLARDAGRFGATDAGHDAFHDARAMLDRAGARYALHVGVGPVAEVVAQLAETLRCDQITMGTHGRSALAEVLMGSTTLKVIHLARVPVLLVT